MPALVVNVADAFTAPSETILPVGVKNVTTLALARDPIEIEKVPLNKTSDNRKRILINPPDP